MSDASGVLAIAAQLAADDGHTFLAGDLWTLMRASLDRGSDDDAIKELGIYKVRIRLHNDVECEAKVWVVKGDDGQEGRKKAQGADEESTGDESLEAEIDGEEGQEEAE